MKKECFKLIMVVSLALTSVIAPPPVYAQVKEQSVREKISSTITTNYRKEISADMLKDVLVDVVNYASKMMPLLTPEQLRDGRGDTSKVVNVLHSGRVWTYRDAGAVSIPDDSATVFKSGTKTYVIDVAQLTPQIFGAKGDGVTNDTKALQKALNNPRPVHIQEGTYLFDSLKIPAGKVVIMSPNAVLKARIFNNSWTSGGLIVIGANAQLSGGIIDGNASVINPQRTNMFAVTYGIKIVGAGVKLNDVTVRNTVFDMVYAQDQPGLQIRNLVGVGVGRGATFVRCNNLNIDGYALESPTFQYTNVYQHCLDVFYSQIYSIKRVRIYNVNSTSAAPSAIISGITLGGNSNGIIEDVIFEGFLSTVNTGLPIADDGSNQCVFRNIVIRGWKVEIGIEVQGSRDCTYDGIVIDATNLDNTIGGSRGIHILDTGITGGILPSNFGASQARDRAVARGNAFSNIKIFGTFTGIHVAGSNNTFRNCGGVGNTYAFRLGQIQGGVETDWWSSPILQRIENNVFYDCFATNCQVGAVIFGGQDNTFKNPTFTNCQVGISNFTRNFNATGGTANTVTTGSTLVTDQWKGYQLYVTNGTGAGQVLLIQSNTASTITVTENFSVVPDATSEFVIVDNPSGNVFVEGGTITDDQNQTYAKLASIKGSLSLAGLNQMTITSGGERFQFNQKLKLLNVVTGASSPDLVVRISSINYLSTDVFNITPVSLGDGSPVSGTLSVPTVNGTGTISSSDFNVGNSVFTSKITGIGTKFPEEIDGQYWILINNTHWAQIWKSIDDHSYLLTSKLPANVTGATFKIAKVDIAGLPTLEYGMNFNRYPGNVIWDAKTKITNYSLAALNDFRSKNAYRMKLTRNSATPTVSLGNYFATDNTSATTITDFLSGSASKDITIYVTDANTTFAFTSSNLRGYFRNYLAKVGDVIEAKYDRLNAKWLCKITFADGIPPSFEVGEYANNSFAPLNVRGGSGGQSIITLDRTQGIVAKYSLRVGSFFQIRDEVANQPALGLITDAVSARVVAGVDGAAAPRRADFSAESASTLSNQAGADVWLSTGRGTGTGALANLHLYTADLGSSGTTTQSRSPKFTLFGNGSVGIGTSVSNVPSAKFFIESTTQGFLPPQMTNAQRDAIPSPKRGLIIYSLTDDLVQVWNGTAWKSMLTN